MITNDEARASRYQTPHVEEQASSANCSEQCAARYKRAELQLDQEKRRAPCQEGVAEPADHKQSNTEKGQ
jgi:hypothetical protein